MSVVFHPLAPPDITLHFDPGDVTLSAEDMSTTRSYHPPVKHAASPLPVDYEVEDDGDDDDDFDDSDLYAFEEEEEHHNWLLGSTAAKFLLAGGIAGAG